MFVCNRFVPKTMNFIVPSQKNYTMPGYESFKHLASLVCISNFWLWRSPDLGLTHVGPDKIPMKAFGAGYGLS